MALEAWKAAQADQDYRKGKRVSLNSAELKGWLDGRPHPDVVDATRAQLKKDCLAREEQRRQARAFGGEIAASVLLIVLTVAVFGFLIPSVGGF